MPEEAEEPKQVEDDEDKGSEEEKNIGKNEKFCKNCGESIDEKAVVCPECGVRQNEERKKQNINVNVENSNQNIQSQNSQDGLNGNKSRMLAAILGIFLGGIGLHKFYLGQAGRGILFLIFSWTLIPALIGFIQGISYLLMSDQKFAQKFG
jgi:RNA polymerase subunit RPABC4/transcription elongation factor Spt4